MDIIKSIINIFSLPVAVIIISVVVVFFIIFKFDEFEKIGKNVARLTEFVSRHKIITIVIVSIITILVCICTCCLYNYNKIRIVNSYGKAEYAIGVDLRDKEEVEEYIYFIYEVKEDNFTYPALY